MTRSYDNTSSHLILKKEIGCNIYAENAQCLDAKKKIRAKGWILKNTRIGPVLDKKVCRHEYRYSIEVLNESLFRDRTASWVRIVSGIDKYVTEAVQPKEEEHRASARPQLKPAVTLSSVPIPVHGRKWIDIETQRSHDQQCYQTSKVMTRLLRHDQTVPREIEEAVLFDDVLEECRKKKVRWCFAMVTQRLEALQNNGIWVQF